MVKNGKEGHLDKPIRILQVFSSIKKGGAESRMMDIYRTLDREKIQFDFLVTSPNPENQYFYSEILNMGGQVFEIRSWKRTGIRGYYKQWRDIMDRPYNCVHTHNGIGSGIPLFMAWLSRIPIRIAHARHSSKLIDTGPQWLLVILKVATNIFSNVKIYCSKEAANYLFYHRYMNKVSTFFLPNAINMDSFCDIPIENREKLRNELNLQKYSYVVGTVGNARPVKNHIFLVRVFEIFLKLAPNSLLMIIGDNREDEDAKTYVKEHMLSENVVFLGVRDDIAELLQLMDLFVLPSLAEGAPGCVIEAQVMNIPCILSDTITKAVDPQTGLVKYISLEAPLNEWAEEMLKKIKEKRPSINATRKLLKSYGYDVSSSAEKLLGIYGIK